MAERETLTVDEVAARLGISRNGAYDAIARGEIPALRVGRRIVVPKLAIARMLEAAARPKESSDAA